MTTTIGMSSIKLAVSLPILSLAISAISGCSGQLRLADFQPRAPIGTAAWTIKAENRKPGTSAWQIAHPAWNREIEGYASQTSVNRGENISIYVNTAEPTYRMDFFRLGWYGGAGGREVAPPVVRRATAQPMPSPDPATGLIECQWTDPYVLHIPDSTDPTEWASGIYLVKLTAGSSGKQSYVTFVVRDDARLSDLLFQSSVTTYEAYNDWGGRSLYTQPRAYKVSFNRPYARYVGAGDLFAWEYSMVRFLEREGYDVTYSTDVDTHLRGRLLLNHNAFLSVGHDEYWSWQMRNNVEQARDNGVSLGFFGADAAFWQIRFARSAVSGEPDRTIICYKDAALDPMVDIEQSRYLTTTRFRVWPVKRPEDSMIGEMYLSLCKGGAPNQDIVISDASGWILANTGLKKGDHLAGLLGYEADRMFDHAPPGTVRIAHSPFWDAANKLLYSDMTYYMAQSGSAVVATGTVDWDWGLDDFTFDHPVLTNPAAQQITRNILRRFGAMDPANISVP